jgi:hypothetical protein
LVLVGQVLLITEETMALTQYFPQLLQLGEVAVATTALTDQVKRVDQEAARSIHLRGLERLTKALLAEVDKVMFLPTSMLAVAVAVALLALIGTLVQIREMAGQVLLHQLQALQSLVLEVAVAPEKQH